MNPLKWLFSVEKDIVLSIYCEIQEQTVVAFFIALILYLSGRV
jgi:hypothetical protein